MIKKLTFVGIFACLWLIMFAQDEIELGSTFPTEERTEGNWINLKLISRNVETEYVGTSVRVVSGDKSETKEIVANDIDEISADFVHISFNLGAATQVDSIVVDWESGERQILLKSDVNLDVEIREKSLSTMRIDLLAGLIFIILLIIYYATRKHRDESVKFFPF